MNWILWIRLTFSNLLIFSKNFLSKLSHYKCVKIYSAFYSRYHALSRSLRALTYASHWCVLVIKYVGGRGMDFVHFVKVYLSQQYRDASCGARVRALVSRRTRVRVLQHDAYTRVCAPSCAVCAVETCSVCCGASVREGVDWPFPWTAGTVAGTSSNLVLLTNKFSRETIHGKLSWMKIFNGWYYMWQCIGLKMIFAIFNVMEFFSVTFNDKCKWWTSAILSMSASWYIATYHHCYCQPLNNKFKNLLIVNS